MFPLFSSLKLVFICEHMEPEIAARSGVFSSSSRHPVYPHVSPQHSDMQDNSTSPLSSTLASSVQTNTCTAINQQCQTWSRRVCNLCCATKLHWRKSCPFFITMTSPPPPPPLFFYIMSRQDKYFMTENNTAGNTSVESCAAVLTSSSSSGLWEDNHVGPHFSVFICHLCVDG